MTFEEAKELSPCPLCGSDPEWINQALADSHFYIKCPHCHIVVKEDRRDKAIGIWNRRVESESLRKEIAELKIQLSNYAYQIDMAKRERDNAVNQYLDQRALNQSLAKQITDLKAGLKESKKL